MKKVWQIVFFVFLAACANLNVHGQTTPVPTPSPEVIEESDEVIRVETDLTNVLFTAVDKDRRFLTDIKKEDVRILEDGKPQEIFTFNKQVDLPLSVAILIDTSGSQIRTLPDEKAAATAFINDVVRQNKDEVAVLSFTGDTTLEQGLTGNLSRLMRAVSSVEYIPPSGTAGGVVVGTPPISGGNQMTAGSTAIWDAIYVTSDEVLREAPEGTRRAIILLTDGISTSGKTKFDEAVEAALKVDATIYAIGIGDDYRYGINEGVLRKLTERTGGRAFFPRSDADLRKAFTQIQVDLRSQYLLAYAPSNDKKDGSFRSIKIELVNENYKNAKLTHRQGYFAKSETPKKK